MSNTNKSTNTKKPPTLSEVLGGGAMVTAREPVLVPRYDADGKPTGEQTTLWARQLGDLELKDLLSVAKREGRSGMVELVAASIENDDGVRFEPEQVQSLRREVSELLLNAAIKVNRLGEEAGN